MSLHTKYEQNNAPQIIKDVGFDFDWDSRKVWALEEPTVEMDIADLLWHFDIPFWEKEGTDDYNLIPWDVINYPEIEKTHHEKMLAADLAHSIDIMENKGRWLILDGLHRLVKAYKNGQKTVKVRKIPRERIPEILRD